MQKKLFTTFAKIGKLRKKLKNQKIQDRHTKLIERRAFQKPGWKKELKILKKLNRSPQGKASIKNLPGNIIDVKNLKKTYVTGNTAYTALKEVNFSLRKGRFIVVVGASGSGKSTLLNVLSGLDRPTHGTVVVNNVNLASLKNGELTQFRRRNVGFVFQSYNLLPSLSARDNVSIGGELQDDGNRKINLNKLFQELGLLKIINKNIKDLSGGEQQRVSIARALAKNPLIIFADEPTGALDTVTSSWVIELLEKINRRFGTTVVIVTHNASLVKRADNVLYVKDGQIRVDKPWD